MPNDRAVRVVAVTGPTTLDSSGIAVVVDTIRRIVDLEDPEELRVAAAPGVATVALLAAQDAGVPRRVVVADRPLESLPDEVREALYAATRILAPTEPSDVAAASSALLSGVDLVVELPRDAAADAEIRRTRS